MANGNSRKKEKREAAKAFHRAIYEDIDKTTNPNELKVAYVMADACQTLVEHIYGRIQRVFLRHGYKIRENEHLSGLMEFDKAVKLAGMHFYGKVEPLIQNATWGCNGDRDNPDAPGNVAAYDKFHEDSNELVRLIMMYVDRCAGGEGTRDKVFKVLEELPSGKQFDEKDFEHFNV